MKINENWSRNPFWPRKLIDFWGSSPPRVMNCSSQVSSAGRYLRRVRIITRQLEARGDKLKPAKLKQNINPCFLSTFAWKSDLKVCTLTTFQFKINIFFSSQTLLSAVISRLLPFVGFFGLFEVLKVSPRGRKETDDSISSPLKREFDRSGGEKEARQ